MSLKDLINLEIVLKHSYNKEELRAFGLKNKTSSPINQLKKFIQKFDIKDGQEVERRFNSAKNIALAISFFLGFLTGISLLKFGIGEFVNIIYFIFFAAVVPLIFSLINLYYILKKSDGSLLPSLIVNKIVNYLTNKTEIEIDKNIIYFYNLKVASLFSLFFSIGLFIALIIVGISVSLPFGWSTTLNINSKEFYKFIKLLGYPISFFIDIPTPQVIEKSLYITNGTNIVKNNIFHNIWWKYLIAITLFYGIFIRFIIYLIAKFRFNSIVKKRFLNLGKELIDGFNEPIISTYDNKSKENFTKNSKSTLQKVNNLDDSSYFLGWGMGEDKIALLLDSLGINAKYYKGVGGLNTIEKDLQIINSLVDKNVTLFVNSYEAPTLDFIDFLNELSKKVNKALIYLVGDEIVNIDKKDYKIWEEKIASSNFKNIYLRSPNDS